MHLQLLEPEPNLSRIGTTIDLIGSNRAIAPENDLIEPRSPESARDNGFNNLSAFSEPEMAGALSVDYDDDAQRKAIAATAGLAGQPQTVTVRLKEVDEPR